MQRVPVLSLACACFTTSVQLADGVFYCTASARARRVGSPTYAHGTCWQHELRHLQSFP